MSREEAILAELGDQVGAAVDQINEHIGMPMIAFEEGLEEETLKLVDEQERKEKENEKQDGIVRKR